MANTTKINSASATNKSKRAVEPARRRPSAFSRDCQRTSRFLVSLFMQGCVKLSGELSRSHQRQRPDEAGEQPISRSRRKQKTQRLSAPVKRYSHSSPLGFVI